MVVRPRTGFRSGIRSKEEVAIGDLFGPEEAESVAVNTLRGAVAGRADRVLVIAGRCRGLDSHRSGSDSGLRRHHHAHPLEWTGTDAR
jgi:hypothetical protein